MTQRCLLVVEDDPSTRKALEKFFRLQGWEVRVASTVAEGLVQCSTRPRTA